MNEKLFYICSLIYRLYLLVMFMFLLLLAISYRVTAAHLQLYMGLVYFFLTPILLTRRHRLAELSRNDPTLHYTTMVLVAISLIAEIILCIKTFPDFGKLSITDAGTGLILIVFNLSTVGVLSGLFKGLLKK